MKPREATSEKKIFQLKRDNYPTSPNKWSILINEEGVSLHPPAGDNRDYIVIPRGQFNAIIEKEK